MNALTKQVGGSHYRNLPYQPIVLITTIGLNFIQGNIVKYVSRYKSKNGKEDLHKAMHYSLLGVELNPTSFVYMSDKVSEELKKYVEMNEFDSFILELLMLVVNQDWLAVTAIIAKVLKDYD